MCDEVKNTVVLGHSEASSHSSIFHSEDVITFVRAMLCETLSSRKLI